MGILAMWKHAFVRIVALGNIYTALAVDGCETDAVIGGCAGFGCFMTEEEGRGPSVCRDFNCRCKPGWCSYDHHTCVPIPTTTTTTTTTTATLATSCALAAEVG